MTSTVRGAVVPSCTRSGLVIAVVTLIVGSATLPPVAYFNINSVPTMSVIGVGLRTRLYANDVSPRTTKDPPGSIIKEMSPLRMSTLISPLTSGSTPTSSVSPAPQLGLR